jgi:adenine-specific DNA-methyltransferase
MARGRPGGGRKARAPAENEIAAATALAPNGNGPAKAYRHKGEKRRNIPPAAIAAEGKVPAAPKLNYSYSPRLDPILRFDATGAPDKLPDLLEKAKREPLTEAEARLLAEALRRQDPWLEWAGKREANGFVVDPVALHIHERVSAQAILKIASRKDVTRDLFADPQFDYHEAVQFYRHEMDWSNRLILGDSLQVMASLAQREDLAGKVQMIYVDPPYGIRFGSNFQTEVGNRESKENEKGLTREVEMIRAFRDTWHLGVHSYLAYLRDRFIFARELLTDSGSVFVQIGDENVHLVGGVLDDVFGRRSRVSQITIQKTTSSTGELISNICDYVLWYAKDIDQVRYRTLYQLKTRGGGGSQHYGGIELANGERCAVACFGDTNISDARFFTADQLQSAGMGREKGLGAASWFPVLLAGKEYLPSTKARWKTNEEGMGRIVKAERALPQETALRYLRYMDDFPAYAIHNIWSDVGGATNKGYVVETAPKVIERCMLMTTEPGDLVLDPTCGGGTTATVAEEWGRRWIMIDTSRVALAIARQRLLTAKFDYYELNDETKSVRAASSAGPSRIFRSEVSRITLILTRSSPNTNRPSQSRSPRATPRWRRSRPILGRSSQ